MENEYIISCIKCPCWLKRTHALRTFFWIMKSLKYYELPKERQYMPLELKYIIKIFILGNHKDFGVYIFEDLFKILQNLK